MLSAQTIMDDLRQIGLGEGEIVLVHSSFKSLGQVQAGPQTVIDALLEVVAEEGTVLMPAHSKVYENNEEAIFDLKASPSIAGIITETFRTSEGTRRSMHPSHSVCARGAKAHLLLASHELDQVAFGPHSPYALLPSYAAKILMLGCGLEPNASIHAIEALAEAPYLQETWRSWTLIDELGNKREKDYRYQVYQPGYQACFDRIKPLMSPSGMRWGRIGGAEAWLIDSAELAEKLLTVLRKDRYFLVEQQGHGQVQ